MAIECPKCKGTVHVDKEIAKVFCMYCRTEIQVKKPAVTGGSGENHEFRAKLAIAEHYEELYFSRGEKSFPQVMGAYDDARQVGAHHAEYWLARARFYAKGKLHEFSKGRIQLSEQWPIIEQYRLWMDTALKHHEGLDAEIIAGREKTVEEIKAAFGKKQREAEKRREAEIRSEEFLREEQREEAARKKPFRIAMAISAGIFFLFLVRISNSEPSHDTSPAEDYVVEYSPFLYLPYVIEFLSGGLDHNEVLNLDLDFIGDSPLRASLELGADRITFGTRYISLSNVTVFDGIDVTFSDAERLVERQNRIVAHFSEHYDIELIEFVRDDLIEFRTDGVLVIIAARREANQERTVINIFIDEDAVEDIEREPDPRAENLPDIDLVEISYDDFLSLDFLVEAMIRDHSLEEIEEMAIFVEQFSTTSSFWTSRHGRDGHEIMFRLNDDHTRLESINLSNASYLDDIVASEIYRLSLEDIVEILYDHYGIEAHIVLGREDHRFIGFRYEGFDVTFGYGRRDTVNVSINREGWWWDQVDGME